MKDPPLLNQLTRVLRLATGDEIILLDNTGFEYAIRIFTLTNKVMQGYVLAKKESGTESNVEIHLYQSLLKIKDKFELVLQKGTEIGVSTFTPLRSERCECKGKINIPRACTILKEAAEQSGRGKIPELNGERTLHDALTEAPGEKLIFDPLGSPLKTYPLHAASYSLFVGPEGGFSESELKQAEELGAHILSIGSRTLRSETAGIVIPALLLNRTD